MGIPLLWEQIIRLTVELRSNRKGNRQKKQSEPQSMSLGIHPTPDLRALLAELLAVIGGGHQA